MDHGPKFVSRATGSWYEQRKVLLSFIDPGKPMQNGGVEAFNGRFHDECLNAHLSMAQVGTMIEAWRTGYKGERLQSSLDYRTSNVFATLVAQTAKQNTEETLPLIGTA